MSAADAYDPGPNPRWWSGLDAADAQRQPKVPILIYKGEVYPYATLGELAAVLAGLLDGAPVVLTRTVATFHDLDTFPAFSVNAAARGADGQAPAAIWVGCVAVQKTTAAELEAAIAAAQATAGVGSGGPEGPTTAGEDKDSRAA